MKRAFPNSRDIHVQKNKRALPNSREEARAKECQEQSQLQARKEQSQLQARKEQSQQQERKEQSQQQLRKELVQEGLHDRKGVQDKDTTETLNRRRPLLRRSSRTLQRRPWSFRMRTEAEIRVEERTAAELQSQVETVFYKDEM